MTIVILVLLIGLFVWAVRASLKDLRSSGGCSNCCSGCQGRRPISIQKRK